MQNLIKAATAAKKQLNVVKLHEQSKKNLEQEIKNYKDEARKQQKMIGQLEKERDRYINETNSILEEVGTGEPLGSGCTNKVTK